MLWWSAEDELRSLTAWQPEERKSGSESVDTSVLLGRQQQGMQTVAGVGIVFLITTPVSFMVDGYQWYGRALAQTMQPSSDDDLLTFSAYNLEFDDVVDRLSSFMGKMQQSASWPGVVWSKKEVNRGAGSELLSSLSGQPNFSSSSGGKSRPCGSVLDKRGGGMQFEKLMSSGWGRFSTNLSLQSSNQGYCRTGRE